MRIEARGLRMRLGLREVLCGLDFVAHAGEMTAVIGPNGAGKTTLLKVLAGLLTPSAGAVSHPKLKTTRCGHSTVRYSPHIIGPPSRRTRITPPGRGSTSAVAPHHAHKPAEVVHSAKTVSGDASISSTCSNVVVNREAASVIGSSFPTTGFCAFGGKFQPW